MSKKEKIVAAIYQAIDEVNELFPTDQRLEKKPDALLYDPSSGLDSVNLVRLIIETEQKIEEAFGINISLTSEKAFSLQNTPFRTVETLATLILDLMQEINDA